MLLRLNLFLNVLNSTNATLLESFKHFKEGRRGVVDRTMHYNFYFRKGKKCENFINGSGVFSTKIFWYIKTDKQIDNLICLCKPSFRVFMFTYSWSDIIALISCIRPTYLKCQLFTRSAAIASQKKI